MLTRKWEGIHPLRDHTITAYTSMPYLEGLGVWLMGLYAISTAPEKANSAWFLVRNKAATYELKEIPSLSGRPLVSSRMFVTSPFPEDEGKALYISGFDTARKVDHNTAWIYRVGMRTVFQSGW
jgi:hypothetical protein